jgi:phage-related protein
VKFDVKFLEDAAGFLDLLDQKPRDKIIYNINKARISNDKDLFKKLKGEIWEFRTLYTKMYYRLFAFWDKTDSTETLVISTHGINKKSKKVSPSEIEKAEHIRRLYFNQKNISHEK